MKLSFPPHLTTEMEINNFSYLEKKKKKVLLLWN